MIDMAIIQVQSPESGFYQARINHQTQMAFCCKQDCKGHIMSARMLNPRSSFVSATYMKGMKGPVPAVMGHLTVLREQLNPRYRYTSQCEQHPEKHCIRRYTSRQVGKPNPLTPHFQKS